MKAKKKERENKQLLHCFLLLLFISFLRFLVWLPCWRGSSYLHDFYFYCVVIRFNADLKKIYGHRDRDLRCNVAGMTLNWLSWKRAICADNRRAENFWESRNQDKRIELLSRYSSILELNGGIVKGYVTLIIMLQVMTSLSWVERLKLTLRITFYIACCIVCWWT